MPLILGTNSIKDTAYEVANSVRFEDGDSPSMYKTPGSSGNRRTWTFSTWFKRGNLGSSQWILDAYGGSSDEFHIYISSGNAIGIYTIGGGFGNNLSISSSNLVRDISAWYHLVIRCDTTQGTASNRLRVYLNGAEVTYASYSNFTENGEGQVSESGTKHWIGRRNAGDYFDGYFAETVLVDGSSLAPTSFGEYDSDSPQIWKPIDVSGLTFGTNGFYLDYEDSSNLGNDANGGTDFTETNLAATDQSTDTPTNNFAVMNSLAIHPSSTFTFKEGNLEFATSSSTRGYWVSTIGVSKGKWYFEYKATNNQARTCVGIAAAPAAGNNDPESGVHDNATIYTTINGKINYNSNSGTDNYYNTATGGDDIIIGCALDLTSATNTIAFSIDGAWVTGDGTTSTDFANVHVNNDFTNVASTTNGQYFIIAGDDGGDQDINGQINFGNPPFSISSGNADANGYGNFEYAVPSGYYSLCTKNLAEYG